jgi:hypothetical protein
MRITITAPFDVGDLVGKVKFDDGREIAVVLRDGEFQHSFDSTPARFWLTTDSPPKGESPSRPPSLDHADVPQGKVVNLQTLFEDGVDIPADGLLTLQVGWDATCHSDRVPDAPSGERFASVEHILCAEFVGLSEARPNASPLRFDGRLADFRYTTPLPLGNNKTFKTLTFGQIIALAGDFYAYLDRTARKEYKWAWPPQTGLWAWVGSDYRETYLTSDSAAGTNELLAVIMRDGDANRGAAGEFIALAYDSVVNQFPARRYVALATQNYCHFVCPKPGWNESTNEALRLYREYHRRALQEANAARQVTQSKQSEAFRSALATDAFGCHFLTDLFASGHIRVPRRLLSEQYGEIKGGWMSKVMHEEDNTLGLWCTTRIADASGQRVVWRAYGDGMLRQKVAEQHKRQVQEAVRRSAAEVFAAFCATQLPEESGAEALLPIPLKPGEPLRNTDILPDGTPAPGPFNSHPNHWPKYWFRPDGKVLHRAEEPREGSYWAEGESIGLDHIAFS